MSDKRSIVLGWSTHAKQFSRLLRNIRLNKPSGRRLVGDHIIMVEVGAYLGKTTISLLKNHPDLFIYAIDKWDWQHPDHRLALRDLEGLYGVFTQFEINLSLAGVYGRCRAKCGDSVHRMLDLAHKQTPVDLIYIDAAHDFRSVAADIAVARRLFSDAVICGDDYAEGNEVHRAVHALAFPDVVRNEGRFWWYARV